MSGTGTEPMSHPVQSTPAAAGRGRFRITALVVVAAAVGVILWLALRNHGGSLTASTAATAISPAQITGLARKVDHPVFWLGPRPGNTYELTTLSNGTIYIRYLPAGVAVGTVKPYATVVTYPFGGAYAALQSVAKQRGTTPASIANGGLAVTSASYPESVHVAYPGVDYQIEVFDPRPGVALGFVTAGKLVAAGGIALGSSTPGQAKAVTAAALRSLAKSLGHPIYWTGPKTGYTYELTQTSKGVFVRYLPAGVQVGSSQSYLTIATYPYRGAFAAMQALSRQNGERAIKLAGGGVAAYDRHYPTNIHLAFPGPGSNYEVEVFDPSPSVAQRLVSSSQVSAIG